MTSSLSWSFQIKGRIFPKYKTYMGVGVIYVTGYHMHEKSYFQYKCSVFFMPAEQEEKWASKDACRHLNAKRNFKKYKHLGRTIM